MHEKQRKELKMAGIPTVSNQCFESAVLDKKSGRLYNLTYISHIDSRSPVFHRGQRGVSDLQMPPWSKRMTMGRLRPTRHWLAFTTIVFLCLPAHQETVCVAAPSESQVDESLVEESQVDDRLYTPVEAEVRAEYQRDLSNQKLQTWREYWGWVQDFYRGNLLADGWTKYSETTLNVVKAEAARRTVITKLNRLGKVISQEWAKDGKLRRINTTDLRRWNDAIAEARRSDDGTGRGITKAIDAIYNQAETQLAG
jgi:hypothetical protein